MPVRVDYKASVEGDLKKLDPPTAARVLRKIERMLASEGEPGEPLSGEFAGLARLRAGDYRVIHARTNKGYLVLRIAHRRDVYRKVRP